MEHVPNVLAVENQDPLKEDDISWIHHRRLCQPARKEHPELLNRPLSPGWGHPHTSQDLKGRAYRECVTKSYVGTSTVLPSTMFFRVECINSLSKASARGKFKEKDYQMLLYQMICSDFPRPKGKTLCPVFHQEKRNLHPVLSYY